MYHPPASPLLAQVKDTFIKIRERVFKLFSHVSEWVSEWVRE